MQMKCGSPGLIHRTISDFAILRTADRLRTAGRIGAADSLPSSDEWQSRGFIRRCRPNHIQTSTFNGDMKLPNPREQENAFQGILHLSAAAILFRLSLQLPPSSNDREMVRSSCARARRSEARFCTRARRISYHDFLVWALHAGAHSVLSCFQIANFRLANLALIRQNHFGDPLTSTQTAGGRICPCTTF